jgi:hypothetical protein
MASKSLDLMQRRASAARYYSALTPHTVLMIGLLFSRNLFRMRTMENNKVICDRAIALESLRAATTKEHGPRSRQGAQQPMAGQSSAPGRIRSNGRQRRRCRCGLCQTCIDNARWERVFNEKFADVEYYGGLRLVHRSPLAGF